MYPRSLLLVGCESLIPSAATRAPLRYCLTVNGLARKVCCVVLAAVLDLLASFVVLVLQSFDLSILLLRRLSVSLIFIFTQCVMKQCINIKLNIKHHIKLNIETQAARDRQCNWRAPYHTRFNVFNTRRAEIQKLQVPRASAVVRTRTHSLMHAHSCASNARNSRVMTSMSPMPLMLMKRSAGTLLE